MAGATCNVNITFAPAAAGPRTGTVTVTDSDPTSPQVAQLVGLGSNLVLDPLSLTFESPQLIGTSVSKSISVTNTGSSAQTVTRVSASQDFSAQSNCSKALAKGSKCNVTVTFTPTLTGPRYGWVTIVSTDPASPMTIRAEGKVGTAVGLTTQTLTFPAQTIRTSSAPQTITITNAGSSVLNFGPFTISNQFSQTNTCANGLAPGRSCLLDVTFSPTSTGNHTGTISVVDSDATSPQPIHLSGVGE